MPNAIYSLYKQALLAGDATVDLGTGAYTPDV